MAVATQADAEHSGAATTTAARPVVGCRQPSEGAQPLFMQLFVTTVFMRRRTVYRRITERLVVAQEDDVDGYTATALVGAATDTANLPVRALWGCRAAPVPMAHADDMRLTRLVFPSPLRRGEKHLFSSEAIDERIEERRRWVNVEIDHHGIATGRILDGGLPVSGLTIRIRFDEDYLPEACWWSAERTERQRAERPSLGDPRLLAVSGGALHHTFAQPCHPRDSYGIFLSWPDR